jgi:hypothetical protein
MKRALAASTRKQAKSTSVRAAMHNSVITMRSIKSMAAQCSLCIAVGCIPPNWLLQTYPDVRHPESCLSSWWASIEMPRLQAGTAGCEEAAPPGTVITTTSAAGCHCCGLKPPPLNPDQHFHIKRMHSRKQTHSRRRHTDTDAGTDAQTHNRHTHTDIDPCSKTWWS